MSRRNRRGSGLTTFVEVDGPGSRRNGCSGFAEARLADDSASTCTGSAAHRPTCRMAPEIVLAAIAARQLVNSPRGHCAYLGGPVRSSRTSSPRPGLQRRRSDFVAVVPRSLPLFGTAECYDELSPRTGSPAGAASGPSVTCRRFRPGWSAWFLPAGAAVPIWIRLAALPTRHPGRTLGLPSPCRSSWPARVVRPLVDLYRAPWSTAPIRDPAGVHSPVRLLHDASSRPISFVYRRLRQDRAERGCTHVHAHVGLSLRVACSRTPRRSRTRASVRGWEHRPSSCHLHVATI